MYSMHYKEAKARGVREKSGDEEHENTQDSEGQVRWDMATANGSRDLNSLAIF